MNVSCTLNCKDGAQVPLHHCIRFSLLRDRYLPYHALHAQFLLDDEISSPLSILFSVGDRSVFFGSVIKFKLIREKNAWMLSVSARSFTAQLMKNQPAPGMYYDVTLASLLQPFQLPHVTWESGMDAMNYVLVKEHAALWNAVIAYNYKLNRGFPYVRRLNQVCVMPRTDGNVIRVPAHAVTACGTGGDSGDVISRIEMANAAGDYGAFSMENPIAAERDIVCVKQMLLDYQFLYDPDEAMQFRIRCGNRRIAMRFVRYAGYLGEDLEDLVETDGGTARVSRVEIVGDGNGIYTTDSFYFDDFCNRG